MLIKIYGIELEVEATYNKASRGARDSLGGIPNAGPPLEPDEEAYWEINSVSHEDEDIYDLLSDNVIQMIDEELWRIGDDDNER